MISAAHAMKSSVLADRAGRRQARPVSARSVRAIQSKATDCACGGCGEEENSPPP